LREKRKKKKERWVIFYSLLHEKMGFGKVNLLHERKRIFIKIYKFDEKFISFL